MKLTKEDYENGYDRQLEEAKKAVETMKKTGRSGVLEAYAAERAERKEATIRSETNSR